MSWPAGEVVLSPFVLTALVLSISLWPHDLRFLRHGDNISYNMYLYHFPLIQLSVWLGIPAYGICWEILFVAASTAALSLFAEWLVKSTVHHMK